MAVLPSNSTPTISPIGRSAAAGSLFYGLTTQTAPPPINFLTSDTLGTVEDVIRRFLATLPASWFPASADDRPILQAVLTGLAQPAVHNYALLEGLIDQLRVRTATDAYLDLIAFDLHGFELPRFVGEFDDSYRDRIIARIFRLKNTYRAVEDAFQELTSAALSSSSTVEYTIPAVADRASFTAVGGNECLQFVFAQHSYIQAGAVGNTEYNSIVYLPLPGSEPIPFSAGYRPLGAATNVSAEGRYISLSDWLTNGPVGNGTDYTGAAGAEAGKSRYINGDALIQQIIDDDVLKLIEDVRPAGCTLWVVLE